MPKKPAKKAAPAPASPEVAKKTVAPAAVPPVTAAAAKSAPPQPKKKPAAKAANGAPPTPAPATCPSGPGPKETTFALDLPEAKQVSLTGQFNAWSPTALPMRRVNNGRWEAKLALPPGRYEYKFVADGNWLADPKATENVFNEHGTLNSVVTILA